MKKKLEQFDHDVDADIVFIRLSENTMQNCYDIVIENEDYTDQSQKSPDITPSKTENIMQEQKMTFSNHVNTF